MEIINQLITNKIIIACFVTLIVSQIMKSIMELMKGKKFNLKRLLTGTGGMPSSHTAIVCALTTAVLLLEGITTLFIVVLIFALVIIRDTIGVRRESGKHATLLKRLVGIVYKNKIETKLNESSGHSPLEVLVGAILGIIVAIIII